MMFVVISVVAVLGVACAACSAGALCAYFGGKDKLASLLGGIGCLCLAVAVVIAAVSTANYDWQAYVCPGFFALGGAWLLVDSYRREAQAC